MSLHTATPEQPSYRKRLGYQAMLLGGICYMVAILIIFGDISTRDAIEKELKQDRLDTLDQVLPAAIYENNILEDKVTVSALDDSNTKITANVATLQGVNTGFAFPIVGDGYSGEIEMLMGINHDGEILGVRVITHAETPGLGDKIEISKAEWIKSFDGHSLANTPKKDWAVVKDGGKFDQFAGATITPRAVVAAVYSGLQLYDKKRDEFNYIAPVSEGAVESNDDVVAKNE